MNKKNNKKTHTNTQAHRYTNTQKENKDNVGNIPQHTIVHVRRCFQGRNCRGKRCA